MQINTGNTPLHPLLEQIRGLCGGGNTPKFADNGEPLNAFLGRVEQQAVYQVGTDGVVRATPTATVDVYLTECQQYGAFVFTIRWGAGAERARDVPVVCVGLSKANSIEWGTALLSHLLHLDIPLPPEVLADAAWMVLKDLLPK